MELQDFNLRETVWRTDKKILSSLRQQVVKQFDKNEQVTATITEAENNTAWHWLATDKDEMPLACISLSRKGQVFNISVLPDYRNKDIATALLEQTIEKARHLGMRQVFIKSPAKLVIFFEKQAFHQKNEVNESALIYMTRKLNPLQTNNQRTLQSKNSLQVLVRDYDTAEVDWPSNKKIIKLIRSQVKIDYLQEEDKANDSASFHFLSQTKGQTIGALRMNSSGKLFGPIVDSHFRNKGIASALIETAMQKAIRLGIKNLSVNSDQTAFLTSIGFSKVSENAHSDEFFKALISEKIGRDELATYDPSLDLEKHKFSLGHSKDFILLRKKEDFQNTLIEMAQQASQSIQIFSPYLDHALFDQQKIRDLTSSLARKNKYTKIEILLFDPHRVIKNGHCLLELSRRLPSSIGIRIVHPELRQLNNEYVLIDGKGYIYRQDVELYEGCANFDDTTECNRLSRQFRRAWESSLSDPNLRQLKL